MYRVIIVDDEPVIRKGLRETIEWDSLGLEVAGEAANGAEALRLVEAIHPEVLITDIRMPEMDGIQLIREIRSRGYEIKITILSGYSDIDYLKAAIRLGVSNYLLKPIDNDELISDLKHAVNEIEQEAVIDLRNRQGTELLRFNTLRRLVSGNIGPEELREKADFLSISFTAEAYQCAVCTMGYRATKEQCERFKQTVVHGGSGYIPEDRMIAFIDGDGCLVLLASLDARPEEREAFRHALEALVERAERDYGVALMIGMGRTVSSLREIPVSYVGARESLEYCVFLKNSGVVCRDTLLEGSRPEQPIGQIDYDRMKSLIRHGERECLKRELGERLEALAGEASSSPTQMQNLLMQIAGRLIDCFREIYGGMNAFREPEGFDFAQLFTLRRFSEMRAWLLRLCDRMFSENTAMTGGGTSLVGMAVAYIKQHYREGVTLKQVAAECHINTSYLGQIFRKEMGCAFTDYVNGLRIREAQRLLANPTLKVYQIAEMVGFTDYHYFLKIFRKVTDSTPTDVRG